VRRLGRRGRVEPNRDRDQAEAQRGATERTWGHRGLVYGFGAGCLTGALVLPERLVASGRALTICPRETVLATNTQQEQDNDEPQRHAEQPEQNERH
jgi:hypothetical protein